MNEWMNEWMKYLMDLLYNLILVELSFWKEQENHNNIYYLYKVYAYDNSRYYNLYEWIRLGLYNNSLIFCDTYTCTCPCLIEVGLLSIGPSNSIISITK